MGCFNPTTRITGADPGFAKGMDYGEHGARAYNGGMGLEPPAESGRASY